MTPDPDSDNLNPDHDSLEYLMEEAHLLFIRKDYPKAMDILQNLLLRYPNNVEVQALWEEVRQKVHEGEVKKQDISTYRSYMPYRNSIGFFLWMIVAGYLFFVALTNDLLSIRAILKTGFGAPDMVTLYDPTSYFTFPMLSWTAPAYVNYLIFSFTILLSVMMIWFAMRDLMRTPPWVNLDQADLTSNPYAVRSAMRWLWWWWW